MPIDFTIFEAKLQTWLTTLSLSLSLSHVEAIKYEGQWKILPHRQFFSLVPHVFLMKFSILPLPILLYTNILFALYVVSYFLFSF